MTIRQTSVIVCTHNRADLLPRVIGQLRAQDYPQDAFEIIVVDNCSTDFTAQVVGRLASEPGVPVRYLFEGRHGVAFARNSGAESAHYPYLAYLDDDCSVKHDWLSGLIRGFEVHSDVAVIGGQVVLDFDMHEKPTWLGIELEPWLGAYNHPGNQAQLIEIEPRVIECNMALKMEAWKSAGGFLGMDQFGSQHMAAGEVLYLLMQIQRQGGKIAYVPGAMAHHHIGRRGWQWMMRRAYWQGISDGILDYLVYRRSWLSTAGCLISNVAAMVILCGYTCFSCLKLDQIKGVYHLMRTIRRFGLMLSQMRFVGDWHRVRSWISMNNLVK